MNTLIEDFRDDIRAFVRSGKTGNEITETLRTRLGFPGKFLNVTRIKEYEEMADTMVTELLFQKMNIRKMLVDKLSHYKPEQVRDMTADNARSHLLWLEVFSVFPGMPCLGAISLLQNFFQARSANKRSWPIGW